MKTRLSILFAVALCSVARGQYDPFNATKVQSMSGQFTVLAPALPASVQILQGLTNRAYVLLDPDRVAVAAERVKGALWRELGIKDVWQGKITVVLHPGETIEDPITIVSDRFREGWNYRVEMPDRLAPPRLVRALVNVLLLEFANRRAPEQPVELPVWFTEGLTQQLLATATAELVPRQPVRTAHGTLTDTYSSGRMKDPLAGARACLSGRPALTFQELSWPGEVALDDDAGAGYRASAQLFVAELLRLKNGEASARAMLAKLPECHNWQTAFLAAFDAQFPRVLDVEKWWALQVVNFTGRDPGRLWTREETWARLSEIVRTPVQVRHLTDQLPVRREATLQRLIQELDYPRQKQVIKDKLRQLVYLRQRSAQELAGLVDDYRNVLEDYLKRRERAGSTLIPSKITNNEGPVIVAETLRLLDTLEARRTALGPKPSARLDTAQAVAR